MAKTLTLEHERDEARYWMIKLMLNNPDAWNVRRGALSVLQAANLDPFHQAFQVRDLMKKVEQQKSCASRERKHKRV